MPEWYSTANNISSFIPSIKQNKNYIKSVKSEMLQQDSIYKNDIAIVDSKIESSGATKIKSGEIINSLVTYLP